MQPPPEQFRPPLTMLLRPVRDRERQINEGEAYANDVIPKAKGLAERLRQEAEAYKSLVLFLRRG